MALFRINLAKIMKCAKYLEWQIQRSECNLRISGVGIRELMAPGIIDRPHGTSDRLLMYFYDPVTIRVNGVNAEYPSGTLMLWPNGASHYYGNLRHNYLHSWLHFNGTAAERLLQRLRLHTNEPVILRDPGEFERDLWAFYDEKVNNPSPDERIQELLLELLLIHLARQLRHPETDRLSGLNKVKNLLDSPASGKISLDQLARMAGLSVPHFIFEFKRLWGLPPMSYQRKVKLEYASYLLTNRNLRICDIATLSGYPDQYAFARAFRKYFAQSPSSYRQQATVQSD